VEENRNLCAAISCQGKKNNVPIPVIASVGGVLLLLLAAVAIYMGVKRGRKPNGKATLLKIETKILLFSMLL
jgi:hypothetical protein